MAVEAYEVDYAAAEGRKALKLKRGNLLEQDEEDELLC
jgi:hypothetical protein